MCLFLLSFLSKANLEERNKDIYKYIYIYSRIIAKINRFKVLKLLEPAPNSDVNIWQFGEFLEM